MEARIRFNLETAVCVYFNTTMASCFFIFSLPYKSITSTVILSSAAPDKKVFNRLQNIVIDELGFAGINGYAAVFLDVQNKFS